MDLIDRQAAIDALGERPRLWTGGDYELGCANQYDLDRHAIETVPSAQPERKTGKWIFIGDGYKCSECRSVYNWWADSQTSNYCPNCGADMRGAPMRYKRDCPYCSAPMRYKRNCLYCGLEIGFMEDPDDGVTISQERRTDGSD